MLPDVHPLIEVVIWIAFIQGGLICFMNFSFPVRYYYPRSNRLALREFDRHLYRARNLIERFFARLKHFRRIATRYDKLAKSFLSFIHLACAFVWLA